MTSGNLPDSFEACYVHIDDYRLTMFASPPLRPLDLKRHLLVRIQRTGQTIRQLITDEIQHKGSPYNRTLGDIDLNLDNLQPIGDLIHFCIRLTDLYSRDVGDRCFEDAIVLPGVLEAVMRRVIGADAMYQGTIGQYPGITVGQITITPNYGNELITLGRNLLNLLAVSLTILFMSFLIYRPVRNALAPSEAMLLTLKHMENGDLQARMPTFALIELDQIGAGFNNLADRLQSTIHSQQRLAHRLLSAREEERQHLARELHDEFGQYLASLNAEAAFARELADEGIPALRPCADAIGRTASHMMETLQQILHHLRPIGLEEFGLLRSLQQLVDGWNQRSRESTVFTLTADDHLGNLPDDIEVSIYRIVQESITNAVRHGQAGRVAVTLQRSGAGLTLEISDDGQGRQPSNNRSERQKSGGFGLLGMEERVLALGGSLAIGPAANGRHVGVHLPLASLNETSAGVREESPEGAQA